MTIRSFTLAGLVLLAAASSAQAADMAVKAPAYKAPPVVGCGYNAITAANNQISVDYAGQHVDYVERNPANPVFAAPIPTGAPLDSEKGWVNGVSVTASGMFNLGSVCNVYLFARGSWFDGHTDYWQFTNVNGESHARIAEGDFRLGKGFDVAPNFMLTPYLGGGVRSWDRDLCQSGACFGGGYHENYSHGYLGVGLMGQFALTPALVLTGSGLVGSTLSSELRGAPLANGDPRIVNFQTSLGNSVIWKLEGSLDYAFTQNIHGNVGVEYTNFKYGESGQFIASTAGPAIEPNSRTETVTVRVGLGWAFGAAPVVAKY
jgi:opacity protein-like surface antigen